MRFMGFWPAVLLFAAAAGPLAGQEDGLPREISPQETPEERLRRIEEKLRVQQDRLDQQQKKIDDLEREKIARKGFSLSASFIEGFHLMDEAGDFDLHLGGRVLLHYRDVFGLPHSFVNGPGAPPAYLARTQPDTFYINSAYLILEGTIYKDWGYRVTSEISTGTAGPNARLETSYGEWKRFKEFSLRGGNFKAPMSPDTIGSPLFLDEIERSPFALFVPNFEVGIMATGALLDNAITYQVALTNGRSYLAGQGRARNDDDESKEVVGRLSTAPFINDKESVLRNLRVGVSGSIASADQVPMQANFSCATTELAVTWMIPSANNFLDGRRVRAAAELAWFGGPVSFRTEGLYRSDEVTRPAAGVDERMLTKAWYAQAGCILTGEEKTLDARIKPLNPYGAVELVARVAAASVERGTLNRLVTDLTAQTNRVGSVTVGVNYWPVQNIRISFDFIREEYYGGIVFPPGGSRDTHLYGVLARFQVDF